MPYTSYSLIFRPRKNCIVSLPIGAAPEKNFWQQDRPSSARIFCSTKLSARKKRKGFSSSLKKYKEVKYQYNEITSLWLITYVLCCLMGPFISPNVFISHKNYSQNSSFICTYFCIYFWLASKLTDIAHVTSFFFTYPHSLIPCFIFSIIFSHTRGTPIWDVGQTSRSVVIRLPYNKSST